MSKDRLTVKLPAAGLAWPAFFGLKLFAGYFATWSWWWILAPAIPVIVELVTWAAKRYGA